MIWRRKKSFVLKERAHRWYHTTHGHVFVFSRRTCQACPRRAECTTATRTGRIITVGPYEEYSRWARKYQKTEEFKKLCHERRPPVERRIAELVPHGLHQTKYRGRRKSCRHVFFPATVVNPKWIFREQGTSYDRGAPLPGLVPILT